MNETIYKYTLPIAGEASVAIPSPFEPLTLQLQNGCPTLWARLDPTNVPRDFVYRVVGTGHVIVGLEGMTYIGTVQMADGLVFHYWMYVPPRVVQ